MKTKLVKIEHVRCNEPLWGEETYVFAPEDWTDEVIEARVLQAQEAYLATLQEYMGMPKPDASAANIYPRYEKYPDLTVTEAKAAHERKHAEYKEWEALQREARGSFRRYLAKQGFILPGDHEAAVVEIDWGHRHGWPIEMDKELNSKDVRLQEKR